MTVYREPGRRPEPWGDTIAEDDWRSFLAVASWDECDADEYIRVFPNLLKVERSDRLIEHIEQALATLSWHCHKSVGLGSNVRSIPERKIEEIGRTHWRTWFPRAWASAWRRREVVGHDEDRRGAIQLDAILQGLQAGCAPAYDERLAASLAFWAAVHPVYIWPEALCRHAMFSAIGWLGFCARGRGAYLPLDIAEWLSDATAAIDAGANPDPTFFYYLRTKDAVSVVRSAARVRLAGGEIMVRQRGLSRAKGIPADAV